MTHHLEPPARTLQEWMDRTGTSNIRLVQLLREEQGISISTALMSYILRGSRRCSIVNARALHQITGVPTRTIRQWPKVSLLDKVSVGRSSDAA